MRPLALHLSALSNDEYELFTQALEEVDSYTERGRNTIKTDGYYARPLVGLHDAREWLRRCFSDIASPDIDNILQLFYPGLGLNDRLTGGQFFAALRLAVHAASSGSVDKDCLFSQIRSVDGSELPRIAEKREIVKEEETESTVPPIPATTIDTSPDVINIRASEFEEEPESLKRSSKTSKAKSTKGRRTRRSNAAKQSSTNASAPATKLPAANEQTFEIGTIFLSKVRGNPPWPAIIVDPKSVPEDVSRYTASRRTTRSYCIRFFPDGDYLTCYAKDIRNLGEPEIKAYIQAPSKRLPKLLLGYQSAMDPKNWLREEELAALKSNSTLNVGRGSTNAESSMSTFRTKRNRNDTIIVGKGSDSSDDSEVLDSGRSAKKAKTSTNTDKTVNSTQLHQTSNQDEYRYGYSRAVRRGPFIIVSGTNSLDPSTGEVLYPTSAYHQALRIFTEIFAAVEALKGSKQDIVRVRVFVTVESHITSVGKALKEVLGEVGPAATMIVGAKFISSKMLVEIEADAVVN